jgi:hypothetical protein
MSPAKARQLLMDLVFFIGLILSLVFSPAANARLGEVRNLAIGLFICCFVPGRAPASAAGRSACQRQQSQQTRQSYKKDKD